MNRWAALAAAFALTMTATDACAAEATTSAAVVDPRVVAALQSSAIAYDIDGGDFRIRLALDGGRSQLVWVGSRTDRLAELELRDVWSIAVRGQGVPPPDLALRLLEENVGSILGAWQVARRNEQYLVIFSAQVPAAASAAQLAAAVATVAANADRLEQELTGADAF